LWQSQERLCCLHTVQTAQKLVYVMLCTCTHQRLLFRVSYLTQRMLRDTGVGEHKTVCR